MKKFATVTLLLLGALEVAFPYIAVFLSDLYYPEFRDLAPSYKLTEKQQELFEMMFSYITYKNWIVSLFGVITIALGIILLLSERRRKRGA